MRRFIMAVLVGIAVGIITYLVIWVLNLAFPGADLDGQFFAAVLGLIAGVAYLITGRNPLDS